MKGFRAFLAAVFIIAPATAMAQAIPDADLEELHQECVSACQHEHAYEVCQNMCACVSEEVGKRWSDEKIERRTDTAQISPSRMQLKAFGKIAGYCADRTGSR
mgnify:CR=1 FL=1